MKYFSKKTHNTEAKVKARYRELVKKYHPDKTGGTTHHQFVEIQNEYRKITKKRSPLVIETELIQETQQALKEIGRLAFFLARDKATTIGLNYINRNVKDKKHKQILTAILNKFKIE